MKTALATPQNWNRYIYASNNPLVRIDPDGKRDIYVAVWESRVLRGQVGHVSAVELSGKSILSQFPVPHGLNGRNERLSSNLTLVKEGRGPDKLFLVFVPDDEAFDTAAAQQRFPNTREWDWNPNPNEGETQCTVAVAIALDAGGVNMPGRHTHGPTLPGDVGRTLDLYAELDAGRPLLHGVPQATTTEVPVTNFPCPGGPDCDQ